MRHCPPACARGFTLIELMIATTIGLLILATLTTIFVKNNQARMETERISQQIENGRYAIQLLSEELRHAGYYAEYIPPTALPAFSKPDACLTDVTTITSATAPAFLLHVQGYDGRASPLPVMPACIGTGRKDGTDVVVVRRVSTCVGGATGCDATANDGTPYFQASLCMPPVVGGTAAAGTQLASTDTTCPLCGDYFRLSTTLGSLTLNRKDCKTLADRRAYVTRIYFIASNNGDPNTTPAIPTLMRAELGATGWTIVPLVEGIENLQVEYGIDRNGDGIPDFYTADPDTCPATAAACGVGSTPVGNWWNTMAIRVHLLARNTQESQGYVDTKTYNLGTGVDIPAANDRYRRHAYETLIRLPNPAGRRQ